jgi:hypothetical protein
MTDTNLYQAPQANLKQTDFEDENSLVVIAKWQEYLIYTFLGYLLLLLSQMGLATISSTMSILMLMPILNIIVFGALVIFNGLLCWQVYGKFSRFIMIALGVVPVFNLLVILAANSRANKLMKSAGYKVGFMGANIKQPEKLSTE